MTCEWPVDRGCFDDLPPGPDDQGYDEATYTAALADQSMAEDTAVMVLNHLTAGIYGLCPAVVRPCPTGGPPNGMRPWTQTLLWWDGAHWFNAGCGCVGRCRLDGPGVVHLPGPVATVDVVTLGTTVLDDSDYTVEGDRLYRRGGKAWPSQDRGRPLGEQGTWSVEYTRGRPCPAGTAKMVGLLAQEFISACRGGACRLPASVVQVTRSGVTHTFDATKMLANGKVGIPEIDLWLNALNPYHLLAPPSVI